MGARPMARVIQDHIKTPLADEVLFGRLKNGGTVRVVVAGEGAEAKLGFVFPEGPVLPRPDKEVVEAAAKRCVPSRRCGPRARSPRKTRLRFEQTSDDVFGAADDFGGAFL